MISPAQLFPGYAFDEATGKITIPIASLNLTSTEANAVTGNAMEVLRQVLDKIAGFVALAPAAAKPIRSIIDKPDPTIATGFDIPPGTLRQTYAVSFDLQPIVLKLLPEPVPPTL